MEKMYSVSVINDEAFITLFDGISYSDMQKWLEANCNKLEAAYGFNYWLKANELPQMDVPYSSSGWRVVFGI